MLPNPSLFGSALADLLGGGGNQLRRPDYRQAFYLALAKVLAAAAWIDGPINQTEVNVVKSLLNELSPRLTTRELRRVQRYLTEPAPRGHWAELVLQLSEFTRRRRRLQFALERLHALLACDGAPGPAETDLFEQARTLLGWHESQPAATAAEGVVAGTTGGAGDTGDRRGAGAEDKEPSSGAAPAEAGIRLGTLHRAPRAVVPAPSPALAERVRAAAPARLAGGAADEPPPPKLAVVAALVAHVTLRRAGTEGEDAELVGFTAAVSGVEDAVAQAYLEEAWAQVTATGSDRAALARELRARTSPAEVAALAKLLNAMADGEAALRRLRELTALLR